MQVEILEKSFFFGFLPQNETIDAFHNDWSKRSPCSKTPKLRLRLNISEVQHGKDPDDLVKQGWGGAAVFCIPICYNFGGWVVENPSFSSINRNSAPQAKRYTQNEFSYGL